VEFYLSIFVIYLLGKGWKIYDGLPRTLRKYVINLNFKSKFWDSNIQNFGLIDPELYYSPSTLALSNFVSAAAEGADTQCTAPHFG